MRHLKIFFILLAICPTELFAAANFDDRSSWPSKEDAPMKITAFPVDRTQASPDTLKKYYDGRTVVDQMLQNPAWSKNACPVTTNYARQILNRLVAGSKLENFMSKQKAPLILSIDCNGGFKSSMFSAPAEVMFGQMSVAGAFFKLYNSEDEIAFIMGHELAHYLLAHDILAWDWSEKDIGMIFFRKMLRERDADMVGLQLLVNAGYDPQGAVEAYTDLFDRFNQWGDDPTHFNHSYLVYNLSEQIKTFGYKTRPSRPFPNAFLSEISREVSKAPLCSALWAKIVGC